MAYEFADILFFVAIFSLMRTYFAPHILDSAVWKAVCALSTIYFVLDLGRVLPILLYLHCAALEAIYSHRFNIGLGLLYFASIYLTITCLIGTWRRRHLVLDPIWQVCVNVWASIGTFLGYLGLVFITRPQQCLGDFGTWFHVSLIAFGESTVRADNDFQLDQSGILEKLQAWEPHGKRNASAQDLNSPKVLVQPAQPAQLEQETSPRVAPYWRGVQPTRGKKTRLHKGLRRLQLSHDMKKESHSVGLLEQQKIPRVVETTKSLGRGQPKRKSRATLREETESSKAQTAHQEQEQIAPRGTSSEAAPKVWEQRRQHRDERRAELAKQEARSSKTSSRAQSARLKDSAPPKAKVESSAPTAPPAPPKRVHFLNDPVTSVVTVPRYLPSKERAQGSTPATPPEAISTVEQLPFEQNDPAEVISPGTPISAIIGNEQVVQSSQPAIVEKIPSEKNDSISRPVNYIQGTESSLDLLDTTIEMDDVIETGHIPEPMQACETVHSNNELSVNQNDAEAEYGTHQARADYWITHGVYNVDMEVDNEWMTDRVEHEDGSPADDAVDLDHLFDNTDDVDMNTLNDEGGEMQSNDDLGATDGEAMDVSAEHSHFMASPACIFFAS